MFCLFFLGSLTWSKPKVNGKPPAARDGHSACVIESRIYIFGGYEEEVKPTNSWLLFKHAKSHYNIQAYVI